MQLVKQRVLEIMSMPTLVHTNGINRAIAPVEVEFPIGVLCRLQILLLEELNSFFIIVKMQYLRQVLHGPFLVLVLLRHGCLAVTFPDRTDGCLPYIAEVNFSNAGH